MIPFKAKFDRITLKISGGPSSIRRKSLAIKSCCLIEVAAPSQTIQKIIHPAIVISHIFRSSQLLQLRCSYYLFIIIWSLVWENKRPKEAKNTQVIGFFTHQSASRQFSYAINLFYHVEGFLTKSLMVLKTNRPMIVNVDGSYTSSSIYGTLVSCVSYRPHAKYGAKKDEICQALWPET